MSEKPMTIDDIAKALGISKTTVSRAISGKGRIGNATRERVLTYIEEHDYRPNVIARGLAQQRTYNIAVVWPMEADLIDMPFFQKVLVGIAEVTGGRGYDVLITLNRGEDIEDLRRAVDNRKVDGVILTRTLVEDPAIAYLQANEVPFVTIGTCEDPGIHQVDNDNETACRDLMRRLMEKGYTRFALMGGDPHHVITRQREAGYRRALEEAGLPIDQDLRCLGNIQGEELEKEISGVLSKKVECLVCMDDVMAQKVLMTCQGLGVSIPGDLSLASFYNSRILEQVKPAVTSISFDEKMLGASAAEQILRLIEGDEAENVVLSNYESMMKESTPGM